MAAPARPLTPLPARVIYLSAVLKVKRKETPVVVTHVTEVGVGLGLLLGVCFWAGVAVGVWALFV